MQKRSFERLHAHYIVEKKLAAQLKQAPKYARAQLYGTLYDQLFSQIPDHPQLVNKLQPEARRRAVLQQVAFVKRFINQDAGVMEIGAGDGAFSRAIAPYASYVYALDVSPEIIKGISLPHNARFTLLPDGISIPLDDATVSFAYSYQLMEHLHPDDARAQLQEIYRVLQPGGQYLCVTPNSLSGPHDISRYFDAAATGFHLKEYTVIELEQLMHSIGFSALMVYAGGKGIYVRVPLFFVRWCERLLLRMPVWLRKKIARSFVGRALLGITILVRK